MALNSLQDQVQSFCYTFISVPTHLPQLGPHQSFHIGYAVGTFSSYHKPCFPCLLSFIPFFPVCNPSSESFFNTQLIIILYFWKFLWRSKIETVTSSFLSYNSLFIQLVQHLSNCVLFVYTAPLPDCKFLYEVICFYLQISSRVLAQSRHLINVIKLN